MGVAIVLSWLIAFFEYCMQARAHASARVHNNAPALTRVR
jgi:uncharacterized protein (DUF486 family)